MATGTLTVTPSKVEASGGVVEHSIVWVSASNGSVTGHGFAVGAGTIVAVEFVPDSGATQPTDLYDVDITDADGASVLDDGAGASVGANLSNATASRRIPLIGTASAAFFRRWVEGGTLTLSVTNAGSAKGGTIRLYMLPNVL